MNLPISRDVADLNLHILLKSVGPEQFVASVAELHDCQVTAPTKERENPWTEFIGMYEGDADFAEIMAELRAERGLEPHSSIRLDHHSGLVIALNDPTQNSIER
jgi:hypothetical protein